MSLTKVASDVYKIDAAIDSVYSFFSDFRNLGKLTNLVKQMGSNSDERYRQFMDKIDKVDFTEDACYLTIKNMGEMVINIVDRESPKLIKFEGTLPFDFNIWIQLLENGPYDTRLKLTFQGELNMMMKLLLKNKLEKGINTAAESLTKIPYSIIGSLL